MKKKYKNTVGVVLAAGRGKRMRSELPKVLHLLCGKALIIHALEALIEAGIRRLIVVVSPEQPEVKNHVLAHHFPQDVRIGFAFQEQPLGTGDAARKALGDFYQEFVKNDPSFKAENVIFAYGDTPAVRPETFNNLVSFHCQQENAFTIIAFQTKNPFGYGRILTTKEGDFLRICEDKDCSLEEKSVTLCNSGFLCANFQEIIAILPNLQNKNSAGEYYLTDLPEISSKNGKKVGYIIGKDPTEFLGINTPEQLIEMENIFKETRRNLCVE